MKKFTIALTLVISSAIAWAQNYPFPLNERYSYNYGTYSSIQLNDTIDELYETWKSNYFIANENIARIGSKESDNTLSEDLSEGMLIMAYMGQLGNNTQKEFDQLTKYYLKLRLPSKLMTAQTEGFESTINESSSTYADINIAFALLIAHKQWSSSYSLNYTAIATELIDALANNIVTANYLLAPSNGESSNFHTSDYNLAALKLFADVHEKYGIGSFSEWGKVYSSSLTYLKNAQTNFDNALFPAYTTGGIEAKPACEDGCNFDIEATKTLWHVALDHVWNGSPQTEQMLNNVLTKTLDSLPSPNATQPQIGSLAMSFMIANEDIYQNKLDQWYNHFIKMKWAKDDLKTISAQLLYALTITGNMPNPYSHAIPFKCLKAYTDPNEKSIVHVTFSDIVNFEKSDLTGFSVSINNKTYTDLEFEYSDKSDKLLIKLPTSSFDEKQLLILQYDGEGIVNVNAYALKQIDKRIIHTQGNAQMLANCENNNITSLLTEWYSFKNDETRTSPAPNEDFLMSTDNSTKNNHSAKLSYTLDASTRQTNTAYAGLGFSLGNAWTSIDLSNASGISFWHKGNDCYLKIITNTSHFTKLIPQSKEWAFHYIDFTELGKPSWESDQSSFSYSQIHSIEWQVTGHQNSGEIWIDNVSAIFNQSPIYKKSISNLFYYLKDDALQNSPIAYHRGHLLYDAVFISDFETNMNMAGMAVNNPTTSQQTIDIAENNLANTYDKMLASLCDVNFRALRAAINVAEIVMSKTTVGTGLNQAPLKDIEKLEKILTEANKNYLIKGITQDQVNKITKDLNEAVVAIENIQLKFDFSLLAQTTRKADSVISLSSVGNGHNQTTKEIFDLLSNSLDDTKATYNKVGISQTDIDEATNSLAANLSLFIENLIKIDFSTLKDSIDTIETMLENASIGDNYLEYPEKAKTELEKALSIAINMVETTGILAQEISDTLIYLDNAKKQFIASQITTKHNSLKIAIQKIDSVLANQPIGTDINEYSPEIAKQLQDTLTALKAIEIDTLSNETVEGIITYINNTYALLKESSSIVSLTEIHSILRTSKALADSVITIIKNKENAKETLAILQKTIAETESMLDTAILTQETISAQTQKLLNAKENLEKALSEISLTAIKTTIDTTNAVIANAQTGEGHKQYPLAAYQDLQLILDKASELVTASPSQAEVDTMNNRLKSALTIFNNQQIKIDFSELEQAIAESKALIDTAEIGDSTNQFPQKALDNFNEAVLNASELVGMQGITKQEVANASKKLTDAKLSFIMTQNIAEYTDLNLAINKAKAILRGSDFGDGHNKYPITEKENLELQITQAEALIEASPQPEEVEKMIDKLNNATNTFITSKITVDFTSLINLTTAAQALADTASIGDLENQYPENELTKFKKAIANASSFINLDGTTKQIVDGVTASLADAKSTFEASINGKNILSLQTTIAQAKELLQTAQIGNGHNQFTEKTFYKLNDSIAKANLLLTATNQTAIDSMNLNLKETIKLFIQEQIKIDFSELSKRIEESKQLADTSSIGRGNNQFSEEALNDLLIAINNASAVIDSLGATKKDIDRTIEMLNTADSLFTESIIIINNATLALAIEQAKTQLSQSQKGSGHNQLPKEIGDSLQILINAISEKADTSTNQTDIEEMYYTVVNAIHTISEKKVILDFSDLEELIEKSNELVKFATTGGGYNQFSEEALKTFISAIDNAEVIVDYTGIYKQDLIDRTAELKKAKQAFEASIIGINFLTLQSTIASANELLSYSQQGNGHNQYTETSINTLKDSISKAQEIVNLELVPQEKVNEMNQNLLNAIQIFRNSIIIVDFAELKEQIASSREVADTTPIDNKHIALMYNELLKAISKASALVNITGVTADSVANATNELAKSKMLFIGSKPEINLTALNNTIDSARTILLISKIGNGHNQYPEAIATTLQKEIDIAFLLNEDATNQQQIDSIHTLLDNAIDKFLTSKVTVDFSNLITIVQKSQDLLDTASIGEEYNQFPIEAYNKFNSILTQAKAFIDSTGISSNDVRFVTDQMLNAKQAFEASINGVNFLTLHSAIDQAEELIRTASIGSGHLQYSEQAVIDLRDSIESALNIASNTQSPQALIDQSLANMKKATDNFKQKQIMLDFTILQYKINDIESIISFANIGNGHNQYPLDMKMKIDTLIEKAYATTSMVGATALTIYKVIEELDVAISEFKSSKITVDFFNLMVATINAQNIAASKENGEGIKIWPADTIAKFTTFLKGLESIVNATGITTQTIDNKMNELNTQTEWFLNAFILSRKGVAKIELEKTLENAVAIKEKMTGNIGSDFGMYPATSFAEIENAITKSELILNDTLSTVETITYVTFQLKDLMSTIGEQAVENTMNYINAELSNKRYLCSNSDSITIWFPTDSIFTVYKWRNMKNNIIISTQGTATIKTAGTYRLETIKGDIQYKSTTLVVENASSPETPFFIHEDSHICSNQEKELIIRKVDAVTIQWHKDDVLIEGANDFTYYANQGAKYTVVLTNSYGCTASASSYMNGIDTPEKPVLSDSKLNKNCHNSNSYLHISNYNENYKYEWFIDEKPLPNSKSANDKMKNVTPGIYRVKATNKGCFVESERIEVEKFNTRTPIIKYVGPQYWYLSSNIANANSYAWYYNGEKIPNATNEYFEAGEKLGIYQLSIEDENGCLSYSMPTHIPNDTEFISAIENEVKNNGIALYPNPTVQSLTIDLCLDSNEAVEVNLFTISGKEVFAQTYIKSNECFNISVDVSSLAEGSYTLTIGNSNYFYTQNIIKK